MWLIIDFCVRQIINKHFRFYELTWYSYDHLRFFFFRSFVFFDDRNFRFVEPIVIRAQFLKHFLSNLWFLQPVILLYHSFLGINQCLQTPNRDIDLADICCFLLGSDRTYHLSFKILEVYNLDSFHNDHLFSTGCSLLQLIGSFCGSIDLREKASFSGSEEFRQGGGKATAWSVPWRPMLFVKIFVDGALAIWTGQNFEHILGLLTFWRPRYRRILEYIHGRGGQRDCLFGGFQLLLHDRKTIKSFRQWWFALRRGDGLR